MQYNFSHVIDLIGTTEKKSLITALLLVRTSQFFKLPFEN